MNHRNSHGGKQHPEIGSQKAFREWEALWVAIPCMVDGKERQFWQAETMIGEHWAKRTHTYASPTHAILMQ